MDIPDLTALELGKKIQVGEVTTVEAARAALKRIRAWGASIHAHVTVDEEGALKRAAAVQTKIEDGALTGPLAGVPMVVKGNICTKGLRTTCSSNILRNSTPTYTAQAISNLEQVGAVILGKTNMDEFAMGSTMETSASGVTRNPWNTEHVPGGSSGGSCVAVAAGECFYALGSGTGGSIRQLGSFCGVVRIKPTYGTMSRYDLTAYNSSLDQIGPVAKDVADCTTILEVLASHDTKDSTSLERKDCDFTVALKEDVKGIRIGIPEPYLGQGLDREAKDTVLRAADMLKEKGTVVGTFDPQLADYAIPAYYVIVSMEASSNLSRFDGVKYGYRTPEYEGLHSMYKKSRSEGFGPEVKRRIMLGPFVLSSGYYNVHYLRALRIKAPIKKEFDQTFSNHDVILVPVSPGTASRLGESPKDPLKTYLGDIHTVSVSLAGLPNITVPCGMDPKGLPIGLQLIGDCFKEKNIIRAAYAYESAHGFTAPSLIAGGVRGEGTL